MLWLLEAAVGTGAAWLGDCDSTAPSLKQSRVVSSQVLPRAFSLSLVQLANLYSEAFCFSREAPA